MGTFDVGGGLVVMRFGSLDETYDGCAAVGWHVTRRDSAGELESVAGPFMNSTDAFRRGRRLLGKAAM